METTIKVWVDPETFDIRWSVDGCQDDTCLKIPALVRKVVGSSQIANMEVTRHAPASEVEQHEHQQVRQQQ